VKWHQPAVYLVENGLADIAVESGTVRSVFSLGITVPV
jgi:hypothetical protein